MIRAALLVLLSLLILPRPGSGAETDDPLAFDLGVQETTLDNGLRVLILPRPGNPQVACRLVYAVGSVNERPGITGISHLIEHMMFKGTKRVGVTDAAADARIIPQIDAAHGEWETLRAAGQADAAKAARARFDSLVKEEKKLIVKDELWRLYQTAGGTGLNAFTSEDVTAYFVTLPANRVELFFWLESDRMQNAVMREFYSEREVVKEERRLRTVNTPTGPFDETLNALAFTAHPYRWPVVGWMCDLDAITREDLVEYRRRYYTPNNAVLCIAGGVDADRCRKLAQEYFGPIPRGPAPPPVVTVEPEQHGRKVFRSTARAASRAEILYHIPAFDDPDVPALEVVEGILSGATGRLRERLVRQLGLARSAYAYTDSRRYPGLLTIGAVAADDTDPEALLAALEMEVRRLKTEDVSADELERVRSQTVARTVRSMRNIGRLAIRLGVAGARGDWRQVIEGPRAILRVDAKDVRRVAMKYLTEENSTVGLLRREKEEPK